MVANRVGGSLTGTAAALVGLGVGQFAEEPPHVVAVGVQLITEQIKQLRVRWRVRSVCKVKRLDQASSHHCRPQPVGDVQPEGSVLVRGDGFSKLLAAAVFGDAGGRLSRFGYILLRSVFGVENLWEIQDTWTRFPLGVIKGRGEGDVTFGLFPERFLFRLGVGEQVTAVQKGLQAVEVPLQIGVHNRVIMALSTFQILAEENSTDVTCHHREIEFAVQVKAGSPPRLGVASAIDEDFPGELIPGSVFPGRRSQIGLPLGRCHILGRPTLHQNPVQQVLHPPTVCRTAE